MGSCCWVSFGPAPSQSHANLEQVVKDLDQLHTSISRAGDSISSRENCYNILSPLWLIKKMPLCLIRFFPFSSFVVVFHQVTTDVTCVSLSSNPCPQPCILCLLSSQTNLLEFNQLHYPKCSFSSILKSSYLFNVALLWHRFPHHICSFQMSSQICSCTWTSYSCHSFPVLCGYRYLREFPGQLFSWWKLLEFFPPAILQPFPWLQPFSQCFGHILHWAWLENLTARLVSLLAEMALVPLQQTDPLSPANFPQLKR